MPVIAPGVRKPLGGLALILVLAVYAILIATASGHIGRLPILAQALFYLIAGIAWVPLLMPLARWIETGRFTKPRGGANPAPDSGRR